MQNISQSLVRIANFSPSKINFPYAWCGHIPFAAWIMQLLKPKKFVELGTHSGNSYFAFCQAVKEASLSTHCYAVDTWQGDIHAGRYSDVIYKAVLGHNSKHYSDFSTLLRKTFDEAIEDFADGSIDLLHIDGLHTYDAVKHDFETWRPKLAPGAVVLFHDTNVRAGDFGVWRLWEELCLRYPWHLEFTHSFGLGVLRVADLDLPKELSWLEPSSVTQSQVIDYFSVLGAHEIEKTELISTRKLLSERDAQLAERDAQLAERDAQLAEREVRIAGYDQAMEQKNEELAGLLHSKSWRLTKPLRWWGQTARFLCLHLENMCRQVYHGLPITSKQRAFLKKWYHRLAMPSAVTAKKRPLCIHTAPSESPYTRAAMVNAPVRILMIERSVPKPDHDAGSLMIFNFIRVLRDLGCAVTFFPADMCYDAHYTQLLVNMGVTCMHAPEVCSLQEHLQAMGDVYDVIVSCRPDLTDPLIPVLRARCPQAKLIYETHDLHFIREARYAELQKSNRLLKAAAWRKKQELRIARGVDCTLVVSEEERDLLLQEDPALNVAVIPVVSEFFGCENGFSDRSDMVFIGGYEHQPNVDAVLYFVHKILPLIIQKQPEIRFHVVGSKPPDKILALANDNVIVHGFVPDISALLNRIKISVNPLRFGAGVKGKLVTCMSYGLPCIGTSIAFEGMHATIGEQALVADSAEDFAEEVLRVYTDQFLWEKLSEGGMALVQEGFSLQTASRRFSAIFRELLPETPRHDFYLERIALRDDLQRSDCSNDVRVRHRFEEALAAGENSILTPGCCFACDRDVIFQTQFEKPRESPGRDSMHSSWEEGVVCPVCGLNSRMRAMIHLFHLLSAPSLKSSIQLIAKPSSSLVVWFQQHYPYVSVKDETLVTTATDCDHGYSPKRTDCTSTASDHDALDTILFSPVIRDYSRSISMFQDFLTSLKPGGAFFFSLVLESREVHDFSRLNSSEMFPASCKSSPDNVADMVRPRETPCVWGLLNKLREMGFRDVSLYACWSQHFGYLGGDVFLARAVKRI